MYVGINLEELTDHVNNRFRNLLNLCKRNKLSLNPLNSEFMLVATKRLESRPQFLVGAELIKEIKSFKYLGNYLNTRLKYRAHSKYLKTKLSLLCDVMFQLSNFFDFHASKNMYSSCINSVISYCIGVWGGVSQRTSRCGIPNMVHKEILKILFSNFFSE